LLKGCLVATREVSPSERAGQKRVAAEEVCADLQACTPLCVPRRRNYGNLEFSYFQTRFMDRQIVSGFWNHYAFPAIEQHLVKVRLLE
jgi:hypothetical protein